MRFGDVLLTSQKRVNVKQVIRKQAARASCLFGHGRSQRATQERSGPGDLANAGAARAHLLVRVIVTQPPSHEVPWE
jgi:hypothetical protein